MESVLKEKTCHLYLLTCAHIFNHDGSIQMLKEYAAKYEFFTKV